MSSHLKFDVIIVGAGAAGLMAAITAGQRSKRVLLLDHSKKIGEKIRISGGGRCNFTNLHASPENYICSNRHFVKSALAGFTQHDFIKLIEKHQISYHEKTLGQLFCDGSSQQIIDMLLALCQKYKVQIRTECTVTQVSKHEFFSVESTKGSFEAPSFIVASGGLSIPLIGASDFGYTIARQFGIRVLETRPALVPLVITEKERELFTSLSGVSNPSIVQYKKIAFRENILFTHKGLSGPAILQISSYLNKFSNEVITINLLPDLDLAKYFVDNKNSKQTPANFLKEKLSKRLVEALATTPSYHQAITDLKKETLYAIAEQFNCFKVTIGSSEGYKKAEVTVGGVDTDELSSKTMESKKARGLYFIGEVVDVTGWLGGYNFQWAWSSGYAAGTHC